MLAGQTRPGEVDVHDSPPNLELELVHTSVLVGGLDRCVGDDDVEEGNPPMGGHEAPRDGQADAIGGTRHHGTDGRWKGGHGRSDLPRLGAVGGAVCGPATAEA